MATSDFTGSVLLKSTGLKAYSHFGYAGSNLGGEGIVRLSDGRLVTCVISDEATDTVEVYVSSDNGATWEQKIEQTLGAVAYLLGLAVDEYDMVFLLNSNTSNQVRLQIYDMSDYSIDSAEGNLASLGSASVAGSLAVMMHPDQGTYPNWRLIVWNASGLGGGPYFYPTRVDLHGSGGAPTVSSYGALTMGTGATFGSSLLETAIDGSRAPLNSSTPSVWAGCGINGIVVRKMTWNGSGFSWGTQYNLVSDASYDYPPILLWDHENSKVYATVFAVNQTTYHPRIWYWNGSGFTETAQIAKPCANTTYIRNAGLVSGVIHVIIWCSTDNEVHYATYDLETNAWSSWDTDGAFSTSDAYYWTTMTPGNSQQLNGGGATFAMGYTLYTTYELYATVLTMFVGGGVGGWGWIPIG